MGVTSSVVPAILDDEVNFVLPHSNGAAGVTYLFNELRIFNFRKLELKSRFKDDASVVGIVVLEAGKLVIADLSVVVHRH